MVKVSDTINSNIDVYSVNSFALFCFQRDYIELGKDGIASDFDKVFSTDPLVRFRSNEGRPLLDAEGALSYLDEHPAVLNLLFWGGALFGVIDHLWNGELFSIPQNPMKDLLLGVVISVGIVAAWLALVWSQKTAVKVTYPKRQRGC